MQAPTFGSFGNSVDDAVRTEFFAFFHLEEEGRERLADGRSVVHFRPSGSQFHDLVTCDLYSGVNTSGRVSRVELGIDRSFIDDPRIGPMARDIARSFIGGGLAAQSDLDQVSDVIRDLESRPQPGTRQLLNDKDLASSDDFEEALKAALDSGEPVIATLGRRKGTGDLPAIVSRGFAVYQGQRNAFARDLLNTRFTMENLTAGGKRRLRMAFDSR